MKSRAYLFAVPVVALAGWALFAQQRAVPQVSTPGQAASLAALMDGLKTTEVSSLSDAMEQLYGTQNFMGHDMRALFKTRFAGPAVTVLLKKEENKEGTAANQGMLDAIDEAPAGSVYVMVLQDGLDYAGMGALMGTAMKVRGFAGAIIDGSIRDLPQLQRIQFPVYSRGVAPSTVVNHFRVVGVNVPVTCGGAKVSAGDIVAADEDGVAVVPRAHAEEVLKKAQALDLSEHQMLPFIEQYKSIREAVAKFGRL